MGDLVRATPSPLVQWQQGRELERLRGAVTLADAQSAAQAALAGRRINRGYDLAEQTVQRASFLSLLVSAVSHDNPGQEMNLRQFEEITLLSAAARVRDYLDG